MLGPNIILNIKSIVPKRRVPRLREMSKFGWQGEDVLTYLNNLITTTAFQKNPLKGLVDFFFARSSLKARGRIYSESTNLFKSEYKIADHEKNISPNILEAVKKNIQPDQRYKFKDVLHLIFQESAKAHQAQAAKAVDKIEIEPLLASFCKGGVIPHEIWVVFKIDIIPALLNLEIPDDIRAPVLQATLEEIKAGKQVNRVGLERIIRGLSETFEHSDYEQRIRRMMNVNVTWFYEMIKKEVQNRTIIKLLERAYYLGMLSEFARGKAILSAEEWANLRWDYINNHSLRNHILKKIVNARDAEHFILGCRTLRVSNITWFLEREQNIVRVTEGWGRKDILSINSDEVNQDTIASIVKAGELTKQIQNAIVEINRNGSEGYQRFLEKKINSTRKDKRVNESVKNAIKDSGAAAVPALIEASTRVGKEKVIPLMSEMIAAKRNTPEEKEIYQALIETMQRSYLESNHPRLQLAVEILLVSEYSESIHYLLTDYANQSRVVRFLVRIPVIGMIIGIFSARFKLRYELLSLIHRLILEILGAPPRAERSLALLRFLSGQATSGKITLSNKLLDLVVNYLRNTQALSPLFKNLIKDYDDRISKTLPGPAPKDLRDLGITGEILIQALQILNIRGLLAGGQLEEARGYAQGAALFARRQNLFTDVTYIPGFLAYSIGNEPREKALEDLKTALRSDRGRGLLAAMGIVQDILKNETYTDLGNIIKEVEPEDLEPRVIVYGALLRTNKFSHERAKRILEELEKDKDLWLKLLDLIGTRQFEEAHQRIASWLRKNLS